MSKHFYGGFKCHFFCKVIIASHHEIKSQSLSLNLLPVCPSPHTSNSFFASGELYDSPYCLMPHTILYLVLSLFTHLFTCLEDEFYGRGVYLHLFK